MLFSSTTPPNACFPTFKLLWCKCFNALFAFVNESKEFCTLIIPTIEAIKDYAETEAAIGCVL